MNVATVLGVLGGGLGLVGLISVAWIVARSAVKSTTLAMWKEQSEALEKKVIRLEQDAVQHKQDKEECLRRLGALEDLIAQPRTRTPAPRGR